MPVKPDCHCAHCKAARGTPRTAVAPSAPALRGSVTPGDVFRQIGRDRPDAPPSLDDAIKAKRQRDAETTDQRTDRLRREMGDAIPAVLR